MKYENIYFYLKLSTIKIKFKLFLIKITKMI